VLAASTASSQGAGTSSSLVCRIYRGVSVNGSMARCQRVGASSNPARRIMNDQTPPKKLTLKEATESIYHRSSSCGDFCRITLTLEGKDMLTVRNSSEKKHCLR
jgi:hypothetical protein